MHNLNLLLELSDGHRDCRRIITKSFIGLEKTILPRHPELICKSDDVSKIAEDYINFVESETVPKSINLDEIQGETKNDSLPCKK